MSKQYLIPPALQPRYYALFAKKEGDYAREVARAWKWERRKPALQTWGDVLFWLCMVPLWVILAISHAWIRGTVLVGLLWLAVRCQWILVDLLAAQCRRRHETHEDADDG